jgi:hydroxyacylglutathione hydrolase
MPNFRITHMISITPIPAFKDNYIWCLHDGTQAWVIDPGDAAPVRSFLSKRQLPLSGILITHHHSDHIGGVTELIRDNPLTAVCGPDNPAIAGITHKMREGDSLALLGLAFSVLEVPGHTLDHIAYFSATPARPIVFCGDTLFAAGCGRLFEGTAEQMYGSLRKLAALPATTAIYCTHEYTLANLRFAQAVEPENAAIKERSIAAAQTRARGEPTLPSTLQLELATNPFLRIDQPAVRRASQNQGQVSTENVQIFAALRSWKDHF